MSTLSPNMNLPLPGVGLTEGPQYATDVNNSLTTIDQHSHSPGSGVPVTPSGLNINTDLSFLLNSAVDLKSVRMTPNASLLSGAVNVGCVYVQGVDLYYNDINGAQVRITQSGAVAGTPGSIANLVNPASATYVSGSQTFVWQSNALTPANLDAASVVLRNLTASSFGLTLNPPNAMGADFSITLPSLPLSLSYLKIDTSGNISTNTQVPGADLVAASVVTSKIADDAITTSKILNRNVTKDKTTFNGAVSPQINDSFVGAGFRLVVNSTVALETSGNPVNLSFISVPLQQSRVGIANLISNVGGNATILILRDGNEIARFQLVISSNGGVDAINYPPGSFNFVDLTTSGSAVYTYNVYASATNVLLNFDYIKFLAYEL